jgi:hypothetical protein
MWDDFFIAVPLRAFNALAVYHVSYGEAAFSLEICQVKVL